MGFGSLEFRITGQKWEQVWDFGKKASPGNLRSHANLIKIQMMGKIVTDHEYVKHEQIPNYFLCKRPPALKHGFMGNL